MPGNAEEVHQIGLEGVARIKQWLEATTYIELPFDVYHSPAECSVPYVNQGLKHLDLAGRYLTGAQERIYVECKRYSSDGGQYGAFQEILAVAYSAALRDPDIWQRVVPKHYFWVTYHPFNLSRWKHLETHQEMALALEKHPGYLGGAAVDENLIREVSSRVTVLVYNPKMDNLTLTREELLLIYPKLDRKGESV